MQSSPSTTDPGDGGLTTAVSSSPALPVSRRQGTVIIILLAIVLVVAAVLAFVATNNQFSSPRYEQKSSALLAQIAAPRYEFQTLEFYGSSPNREGAGAFKYSSIDVDQAQLDELGAKGWEVVGSYLEMETAWANFGDDEYVTGLQPNVRPQRLVVILQHRVAASD